MKIGIDIRPLIDKNYSGVSWYTFYLVRAILENDNANEYVLFYNSFKNLDDRLPEFDYPNVKFVRFGYPNKLLNFLFKFLNWPKIDKLLGVDILLMTNINFISVSKKCKIILTIHDLSFLRHKEFFNIKMRLWHWFVDIYKIAKRSDHIVAVSENTKQDIVELLKIQNKKVNVVYSGISEKYKKINHEIEIQSYDNISEKQKAEVKELAKVKRKYDLPDNFLLYLGTIEPRKNISAIISSYNILRDNNNYNHKLILVGVKGWKSKHIFKEWQKSKYKKDIIFLNYINDRDKVSIYNLAALFIFPSIYEGFGFPPLESLACGTPVVASFSSSLNEIVGEGAILVDPYSAIDIAKAVEEGLKIKKNQQNYLKIKEKFNWQSTAKGYLKIMSF
jgi:glycosyltransferase involved in cell wall biosynthesis